MPNRIIKESIRDSKTISSLTDFEFRLWVCLITFVDDYGRGTADPELIKGHVFPRRPKVSCKDIKEAMVNLSDKGCIVIYEVDHELYFYFPKWANHQRIQTKKSKYPDPDTGIIVSRKVTVDHGESPLESNPIQSNPNPNPNTIQTYAADAVRVSNLELEEEFNQLWEIYPRKEGKKNAFIAYQKARKNGTSFEDVAKGLENYCNYIKLERVEQRYIKHGSTWFNQNCWNDDYTVKRQLTTKDIAPAVDFSDF